MRSHFAEDWAYHTSGVSPRYSFTISKHLDNTEDVAVDALCIIQGPDGDWKDEAARMRDVYEGSLITIAAADGKNIH